MDNYEKLVERIANSSGLDKDEIERKVEAKKAKLSGLISREGAAQIVAAELGINFDNEQLKISELVEGMKRVNVLGKIIKINPTREFNKNGREGKVGSFVIGDTSSNIRTVLWDTNHISLIEQGKLIEGSVIEISNGNIRNSELHLSSFADIKLSKEKIDNVVTQAPTSEKNIKDAKPGESIRTRATIVHTFEPRYFEVNPQTGKKITEEDLNNKIRPQKRALLNLTLDDGTETIRTVVFHEQIKMLGLTEEQIFSLEEFTKAKETILGAEKIFIGQVRSNQLYNTTEFSINKIEEVDTDNLIKELEAKA